MSSEAPPLQIGALLRFPLHALRSRIYAGVLAAGFDDVRPAHVTLFRWPGPDGRRPTDVAADAHISKQHLNDLLRELEHRGYLALEHDPADARARRIRLSARGHALHRVAIGIHADVEAEWESALGARRYAQLRAALSRLTELTAQRAVSPPRAWEPRPRAARAGRSRARPA